MNKYDQMRNTCAKPRSLHCFYHVSKWILVISFLHFFLLVTRIDSDSNTIRRFAHFFLSFVLKICFFFLDCILDCQIKMKTTCKYCKNLLIYFKNLGTVSRSFFIAKQLLRSILSVVWSTLTSLFSSFPPLCSSLQRSACKSNYYHGDSAMILCHGNFQTNNKIFNSEVTEWI